MEQRMNMNVEAHVYPGDARIKWPNSELADLVALGEITLYCRNSEHARRVVNALNNMPERDLNTSLIDTMFLIWSLHLMSNLKWQEVYDFIHEAIGIRAGTVRMLFQEANKRINGGATEVEKAHKLKIGAGEGYEDDSNYV